MRNLLVILSLLILETTLGQTIKGKYVGLEEMWCEINSKGKKECYQDPSYPKHKWFRLSQLTFNGDSVFLYQSPIALYKKDTVFSASDGGFYNYKGTYNIEKGIMFINLDLDHCDYCPTPVGQINPVYRAKKIRAILNGNDLLIDGYLFKETLF